MGIKKKPQDAKPSKKTRNILLKLADKNNIVTVLVSGHPIGDLLKFFSQASISNISFIGGHGAELKYSRKDVCILDAAKK